MRARSRIALAAALSASSLTPSLAQADPPLPTHVACVGDSITFGYAASSSTKSYPSVLQSLFGSPVKVSNFGHNGATLLSAPYGDTPYINQPEYQGATDFVTGAGAIAVVDVIILLGTNDSKPANWTPPDQPKNDQQFLDDYRALVDHFTALTPKPTVFLGLPLATGNSPCCSIDGTVIHDQILPLIKQVAQEKQLPIIDLNTPTTGHPEYFSDGVHPTDAAYAIVAGLVHDGLLAGSGSGSGSGGSGGAGAAAGSGGRTAGEVGGAAAAGASSAGSSSVAGSAGAPLVAGSAGTAPSAAGAASAGLNGVAGANSIGGGALPAASSNGGGCAIGNPGNPRAGGFAKALLLALAAVLRRRRRGHDVLQARERP